MPQITNIHTGTNSFSGAGSTTSVPNPWRPVIAIVLGIVFLLIVIALLLFSLRYQRANMEIVPAYWGPKDPVAAAPMTMPIDVSPNQGGWANVSSSYGSQRGYDFGGVIGSRNEPYDLQLSSSSY